MEKHVMPFFSVGKIHDQVTGRHQGWKAPHHAPLQGLQGLQRLPPHRAVGAIADIADIGVRRLQAQAVEEMLRLVRPWLGPVRPGGFQHTMVKNLYKHIC